MTDNNGRFSEQDLRNWIPTKVCMMLNHSDVRWRYIGLTSFSEPFFFQTVERLESGDQPERRTDVETLEGFADSALLKRPSAAIIHITRCGSTLVANALKTLPDSMVLSEPHPILSLLMAETFDVAPAIEDWEERRKRILRGLLASYSNREKDPPKLMFLKGNAWTVMAVDLLRTIWPGLPCVFIYREPVEVLVSNLNRKPKWWHIKDRPLETARILRWPPESDAFPTTDEEFGARVIGRCMQQMVQTFDERTFLLNYEHINVSAMLALLNFIEIESNGTTKDRLENVLSIYSKDTEQRKAFEPDQARKQKQASPLIREMSERWAAPAFAQLEEIRKSNGFDFKSPWQT